ncbi:MAG: hypothetical protein WEB00_05265 [Dehalococcoidia bacterium]
MPVRKPRKTRKQPLYREDLTPEEQKFADRASGISGVREEIRLLRIRLQRTANAEAYDLALKIATAIARLEETESRIRARDSDPQAELEEALNVASARANPGGAAPCRGLESRCCPRASRACDLTRPMSSTPSWTLSSPATAAASR